MSGFIDYVDDHELDAETDLYRHFFGGLPLLRRGKLKWKIGITRQIIAQRRKRGAKMHPVDGYLLPLARFKQLYRIKRPLRLWHYMYMGLRLRNPRNVGSAAVGRGLFDAFSRLNEYLRKQGIDFPMNHSLLLSSSASGRLSVPRVEDLETERLSDLATEQAMEEVTEHTISSRRGLGASCIQGYIDDAVDHAIDSFVEDYFEKAMLIVDEPDVFVTLEYLQSTKGGDEEGKMAGGDEEIIVVDESVVERLAKQYDESMVSVLTGDEPEGGGSVEGGKVGQSPVPVGRERAGDEVSVYSNASDRSYLISSRRGMRPNVLMDLGPEEDSTTSTAEQQKQDALSRENEALRRMLRALAVNPDHQSVDTDDRAGTGRGKKVTFDLEAAASAEMSLSELDAYLNEAGARAATGEEQEQEQDDDSLARGMADFKAAAPRAASPDFEGKHEQEHEPAEAKEGGGGGDDDDDKGVMKDEDKSASPAKAAAAAAAAPSKASRGPPGPRRPKRQTWEEKEAERRQHQRRARKLVLLSKAEDHMRAIEEAEAKALGTWSQPKRERLLSSKRTLPEEDLVATTRVAKQVIVEVRSKLSAGNLEVINKELGLTERKLLESPFGTPFAKKYQEKIEKEERERRKAELLALVKGGKKA